MQNEIDNKTASDVNQGELREPTLGESRVRVEFNPSNEDVVYKIKQKTAELINLCESLKNKDHRCAGIAQNEFESACMWAVKAATA